MSNPYYTASGTPPQGGPGLSVFMRAEFNAIQAAFDNVAAAIPSVVPLLPQRAVVVNASGTGYELSGGKLRLGTDLITSGTGATTFQAQGTVTVTVPPTSGEMMIFSTFCVNTLSGLKALTVRPPIVYVLGYTTAGDGGGGEFYWEAGSATSPNDGTVVQCTSGADGRYKRPYSSRYNVLQFGATIGGDATARIQATIDAASAMSAAQRPVVYFPAAYYYHTGLSITADYLYLEGDGRYNSVLVCASATGQILFTGSSLALCGVRNLGFTASVASTDTASALVNAYGIFRFDVAGCFFNGLFGSASYANALIMANGNSVKISNTDGVGGITYGVRLEYGSGGMFMNACIFNQNQVTGVPLSIYAIEGGDIQITNSDFIQGSRCEISGSNFGTLTSCYFDSAQGAVVVSGCEILQFVSCQFANRVTTGSGDGAGIIIGNSRNCVFSTCAFVNNGTDGVQILADNGPLFFIGCLAIDNNTTNYAAGAGYQIAAGASDVQIIGGCAGNGSAILGGYQVFGIALNSGSGANNFISGVDVRNNNTAGIADNAIGSGNRVIDCLGYNPIGADSFNAGTSPYSLTSGHASETIYISGGTVSDISIGGVSIGAATDRTVQLGPNETVVITHSVAPIILRVRH